MNAPVLHPLLQRLLELHGAALIDPASLEAWLERPGEHVLFFSGDPVRFAEVLDVAVVLPELRAACGDRFDIGVVPRAHEDALARRFGVLHWPSLVFMRGDAYLGVLAGMQDWGDYLEAARQMLERPASRAPGVGIAVVAAAPARHCH